MNVRVRVPLGFVERLAAGEHDVGAPEQLGLARLQLGRRAGEAAELVHAVVHDRIWRRGAR